MQNSDPQLVRNAAQDSETAAGRGLRAWLLSEVPTSRRHAKLAAIYRGCGNEVLEESAQSVRARLAPFRSAQFHIPGRVAKSVAEHSDVVAAILKKDGDSAYQTMRAHMLTVSDASAVFAARTPD